MPSVIIIAVLSYLVGSIPFGYILVRVFTGQDVRRSGSGNIGATNVARSSPWLGLLTLVLDAGKGSTAVAIAMLINQTSRLGPPVSASQQAFNLAIAALVAVLGHMFPVWLKFKGGKGVATGLGSFVLIAPKAILMVAGVFVVTLLAFRYVSFASIIAVAFFPLLAWRLREYHQEPLVLAFLAACSFMIVLKHHQNIRRLLSGSEPRFRLRRG